MATPSKTNDLRSHSTGTIATPEDVMTAARQAPQTFRISDYHQAIALMRGKGHSWRALVGWLRQFNIEISHVHLCRLYQQESVRRSHPSHRKTRRPVKSPPATVEAPVTIVPVARFSPVESGDLDVTKD